MTYQEKFEQLKKEFALACDRYMKAEKQFSSILGWGGGDKRNTGANQRNIVADDSQFYS